MFIEGSEEIDPIHIAPQSNHLRDLSTNLLGVFNPINCNIRFNKRNAKYFMALWNEGDKVKRPHFLFNYLINSNLSYIYFKVSDLLGEQIYYSKGQDQDLIAECRILHTPTNSNFWHFSIRWNNEEGDTILQKGRWKKRLYSSARAFIQENAIIERPDFYLIDDSLYMREK